MVRLLGSLFFIAAPAPAESGFSEKYEHDDNDPQWVEGTPLPMCRLLRFIRQSHETCPYDELSITRLARFCAGHVAPQSTCHDLVSTLLATPRAAGRNTDRVAAFHHRVSHPATRLLPLAAPPHGMPDRGPRAWP